jgi:hypothetical protein
VLKIDNCNDTGITAFTKSKFNFEITPLKRK